MSWGAALRLAVSEARAARQKNSAQNAALDEFYALKSISGWRQGVRCLDWVTRKDGLALTVQWARRRDPSALGCVPAAYELPRDRAAWMTASRAAQTAWWIAKPANSSNSDGIRLLSAAAAASEFASAPPPGTEAADVTVLQQYVSRPALIGGLKFDLRLYVLVLRRSRASAPVALLFCDGLARFATAPYACPEGVEGPAQGLMQGAVVGGGVAGAKGAKAGRGDVSAVEETPPLLRAHLTNYVRAAGDGGAAGCARVCYPLKPSHIPPLPPFFCHPSPPAVAPGSRRAGCLGAPQCSCRAPVGRSRGGSASAAQQCQHLFH